MKFHDSLIDRIAQLTETYGGYRDEHRLKTELKKLSVIVYTRETGEEILVDAAEMKKHTQPRR